MTDTLTIAGRSERMSRVRASDTKPEMIVRRMVLGMGYRYCLHDRHLRESPNLVFRSRRHVISVNSSPTQCRFD
ncbi:hypothetical protein [Qipengyuania sp. MTN3-11]|uniref:hypothetical protein n=1 Tax=Qipengyuania sp. MTN3-11 TaxID=3056557 RepID=UPI0036F1FB88